MSANECHIPSSGTTREKKALLFRKALAYAGITNKQASDEWRKSPACISKWASGEREVPDEVLFWALFQARAPGMARVLVDALIGLDGSWHEVETGELGDARDEGDEAMSADARMREAIRNGAPVDVVDGLIDATEAEQREYIAARRKENDERRQVRLVGGGK